MKFDAVQSNSSIGVTIHGFDAANAGASEYRALLEQVYEHKVVVLKNQSLATAEFNALSHHFGEPVPYLQSNYHHPDYPLIFVSSNVKLDGDSVGVARTGGYWHSDTSFLDEPVPLTLLYPRVVPLRTERTTLFIDLQAAYDALPSGTRQELDRLQFVHSGRWKYKVRAEDAGMDISEILALIDQIQPPVTHPAVLKHPVTGARSLYLSRGFTIGVDGWEEGEARRLLDELFDHVEQEQFISTFTWELGDLILWDNRFLAHKAGRLGATTDSPLPPPEEDTMVFRIIVKDAYPLSA